MSTPPANRDLPLQGIFGLVVSRPVAVWMIAIAAAVFGFVSYQRLPLDLMPDLAYPSITVRTEAEGYAPEEVEGQVSRPVEEALATTQGLVELESRSRAGLSDVVLEFTWGTDMDQAAQDVRESLQTTFLPDDVGRPLILRYDPTLDPILRIALSGDGSDDGALPDDEEQALLALRELAERELKRELEAMDGVAAVQVRGGLEREVLVEARQDWLAARGVTVQQLITALGAENVNLPGGAIRDGDQEFLVRTLNEVRTVEEIQALEVRRMDGVGVPVRELATVREAHKDREVESRLNGRPAVILEVYKTADANIVRVAQSIQARLGTDAAELPQGMGPPPDGMPPGFSGPPTLKSQLPAGVEMVVLENQAEFIEQSLDNLRSTALLGAALAIGVLFLFLRDLRATLIIGAAIPLSVVVTFAPMYLGGVSLNLMSLGGLALGIGMLVDNAVVVLENIQVHLDRGVERRRAAIEGTREVAAAVTASTLTTVSVFLPIAFVEGIAGQVFGDLSLAVVFSLLASLVVALFFVPVLAAADFELRGAAPEQPVEPGVKGATLALLQAGRASRFRSWPQLRDAVRAEQGWRKLAWTPYFVARFLLRLSFELLATLVLVPAALFARLAAGVASVVLPPLHRLALWAADRFQAVYGRAADRYDSGMAGILRRGGLVLGLAAMSVLVAIPLAGGLGQALIPEVHQGRFTAELALPVGTPLPRTSAFSQAIEERVATLPGVAHVHAVVGSERRADSGSDEGEHTARIAVELTPGGSLSRREDEAMARVREVVAEVARGELSPVQLEALPDARPGSVLAAAQVDLRLVRPSLFSFRTPIEVVVYDQDLPALGKWSDEVRDALTALPGLTDVRSSLTAGYPEVRIHYDRDLLERFGLDTGTVARRVREKVQGEQATTLSRGTGRIDLTVRLAEEERRSVEQLRRINVNPNLSPPIPLEAVATFVEGTGPSEIRRIDQRRAAVLTANIDGFDLSGQATAIHDALQRLNLPAGSWEIAGQNREMQRSLTSLQLALGLAVFLVYVIMASTFESVLHPFVILFSVPLALVGVVAALLLAGTPVSVVVLIGAIVLAGVVVNNAIVMVDTINRNRADGMERVEAVHRASVLRLRPILITTTTTVLGLLPLALGLGEGAEIQQPLALTVIAGLSSSTLLTLVVIPVVYIELTRRLERGSRGAQQAEAAPLPEPGK